MHTLIRRVRIAYSGSKGDHIEGGIFTPDDAAFQAGMDRPDLGLIIKDLLVGVAHGLQQGESRSGFQPGYLPLITVFAPINLNSDW